MTSSERIKVHDTDIGLGKISIGMAVDWYGKLENIPDNFLPLDGRSIAYGTYSAFEAVYLQNALGLITDNYYMLPTETLTNGYKIVRVY